MLFFKNIFNWFDGVERNSGWIKIVIVCLLLILCLVGFLGWNMVKDLTNTLNKPVEDITATTTGIIDDGKEELENQKQQIIDAGNEQLDKGRKVVEEKKQELDKAIEKAANIIEAFKK